MSKKDMIETQGKIIEALPNGKFRVELDTGQKILAYVGGKMRIHYVKIVLGDTVTVELSPYDLSKGIIAYRFKHQAA
jgi:translation initiation factor IF-1